MIYRLAEEWVQRGFLFVSCCYSYGLCCCALRFGARDLQEMLVNTVMLADPRG